MAYAGTLCWRSRNEFMLYEIMIYDFRYIRGSDATACK